MKRIIFTLITLLTVSFANAQMQTYVMTKDGSTVAAEFYDDYAVNENGIIFDMYYMEGPALDTIYNEDGYSVMYEMIQGYGTTFDNIKGPAVIYDIYGHIKYHITEEIFNLNPWMRNELQYGAYIVAPYGYKPFKVYNGCPLYNEGGKFTPIK